MTGPVIRWARRGGVLAALVAGCLLGPVGGAAAQGSESSAPRLPATFPILFGGPFSLTGQDGKVRTDKDYLGKFMLIYFGYTYCPDICPTNLQTMADALDMVGEPAKKIVPIFISIDPGRDTPKALKEYVANFHPRMQGLTGTEAQIRAVAKAYRQHRRKIYTEDSKDKDDYLMSHSSLTFLMGPDGKFVTLFPHDTKADFMAKALKKHLRK